MIRPTEKINRAILALDGNPNWEEIKKWFNDSYLKLSIDHIQDMISSEAKYRVLQGQVKNLLLIRSYIANAKNSLTMSEKEKDNLDRNQNPGMETI